MAIPGRERNNQRAPFLVDQKRRNASGRAPFRPSLTPSLRACHLPSTRLLPSARPLSPPPPPPTPSSPPPHFLFCARQPRARSSPLPSLPVSPFPSLCLRHRPLQLRGGVDDGRDTAPRVPRGGPPSPRGHLWRYVEVGRKGGGRGQRGGFFSGAPPPVCRPSPSPPSPSLLRSPLLGPPLQRRSVALWRVAARVGVLADARRGHSANTHSVPPASLGRHMSTLLARPPHPRLFPYPPFPLPRRHTPPPSVGYVVPPPRAVPGHCARPSFRRRHGRILRATAVVFPAAVSSTRKRGWAGPDRSARVHPRGGGGVPHLHRWCQ